MYAALKLARELTGEILDVGGGGEGIIGRAYGPRVTAIDNRQEELDEAPEGPRKLLMDAAALAFPDASFHHVTFFFSLMYMPHPVQERAISEAARVLRPGGCLHIWDAEIACAYPEPFLAELDIDAAGEAVHTTYGIVDPDAAQDSGRFLRLCQSAGLRLVRRQERDGCFYLCFSRQSTLLEGSYEPDRPQ